MRVELWNPNKFDIDFENIAMSRLVEAAHVVADEMRKPGRCPVGTISRPMYKSGPYAGQEWTSRDEGRLKRSIRVTRKRTKSGKAFSRKRNVRVYAGSFPPGVRDEDNAYYAQIVEYYTPFMRPGLEAAMPKVKEIIGAK